MFGFAKRLTHLDAVFFPRRESNFDLHSSIDIFFWYKTVAEKGKFKYKIYYSKEIKTILLCKPKLTFVSHDYQ